MKYIFQQEYKTYINHTDAGGIVYHGNYLTFYENCRRDWFSKIGLDAYFFASEESNGLKITYHPVVSKANIIYSKPILLDMLISVTIDSIRIKPASLIFTQSIFSIQSGQKLSSIEIVIACVKNETNSNTGEKSLKPARMPQELVTAIEVYQQPL